MPKVKGVNMDPANAIELTGATPRFAFGARARPKAKINKPRM